MNKASGGDRILAELFQILKDDAVVLHSICQLIWKTAVATVLEKFSFHSNPKEKQCQRMFKLLPNLELVHCSMSGTNCCFFTFIQVSQEADKVVWYSHLLKNFVQFVVIYTVKGFGIVNKAEIDVFLELSCFFYDPTDVDNLISGSSAFSKTSLNIRKFTVHILLKPGLENFEHYFASV